MFDDLLEALDAAHARLGREHLELLRLLVRLDRTEACREQGARTQRTWSRCGTA